MKLGVIGEPCIDYIHRNGKPAQKHLGGILYSLVSLSVIAGKQNEVYPVMNLGEDEFSHVTSFLAGFENIRQDYIYSSKHKTRIVNLHYSTENNHKKTYDREENSTEPTLPLTFEQIGPALSSMDGILVNMVSGIDIELDTLEELRNKYDGYIHMDLHNVVMKTFPDGKRERSPVNEWLRWCANCDTLQMNEAEISILQGTGVNEKVTAEQILSNGKMKSITITRGSRGASVYVLSENKNRHELSKQDFRADKTNSFKDSTGCGDVLGSSFFYKTLQSGFDNLNENMKYAVKMASRNAELTGVEELKLLVG